MYIMYVYIYTCVSYICICIYVYIYMYHGFYPHPICARLAERGIFLLEICSLLL